MRSLIFALTALAACQEPQEAAVPKVTAQATPGGASLVSSPFQGDWATDAAACAAPGHESRLTITGRDLRFYESRQTVVSSSQSSDGEISLQTMAMGEGAAWTDSHRFRLSADGRTLTDAQGMARQRCPG